ncbi:MULTISPECIES: hypothetical protein [unclassified Thioalkalivibrio]|uniref:hypothetical protein n=1 Tax=unclassified Thioalkalivibrio TaxID=2621013 RepID=UPI0003658D37|nr:MULTISPECIES: hypothetical protein [unclassified Thioalkalivibrio]
MLSSRAILVAVLGALLFLSPLVPWVAHLAPAWWWPFVAWAAFIGVIALAFAGVQRDP